MKHLILVILGVAMFLNSYAGANKIYLYRNTKGENINRPTCIPIPNLEYEQSTLKIKCKDIESLAFVVIKDITGKVIFTENIRISSEASVITLPDDVDINKCTIEITYDNENVKGDF